MYSRAHPRAEGAGSSTSPQTITRLHSIISSLSAGSEEILIEKF